MQWPLSVGEGINWQHGGVEYTISLPDHVKIGGRIAEECLESLLHALWIVAQVKGTGHQSYQVREPAVTYWVNRWDPQQ